MQTIEQSSPLSSIDQEIDGLVRRVLVPTAWTLLGSAALTVALLRERFAPEFRPLLYVLVGAVAACVLALTVLVRRGHAKTAISLLLGVLFFVPIVYGIQTSLGANATLFALFPVVVIVAAVLLNTRSALIAFVACSVATGALYLAETQGALAGVNVVERFPSLGRALGTVLATAIALMFGHMLRKVSRASVVKSRQQALRLQRLAGLAADWYWEQDAEFRFTHLSSTVEGRTGMPVSAHLGRRRWDLEELERTPEQWDEHRAVLRAHQPFRDFIMKRRRADGSGAVYVSISGEPTFASDGTFTGYWGIGREVTAEFQRRREMEISERRYQTLFAGNCVPLIVHRCGTILQVNRATLQLLRFSDEAVLVGTRLQDIVAHPSRTPVAERLAILETLAVDATLPWNEVHLLRSDGTPVLVQASITRIELPDGVANLSQLVDMTDLHRAETERARSETLMRRMFDTSPDYITVRRFDDGRMVLANASFHRAIGYAEGELVGKTSDAIDLWVDAAERKGFTDLLAQERTVQGWFARFRARDGRILRVLISAAVFEVDDTELVVATARDITSEQENRLQTEAILAHASVGIAFTREQRFVHLNEQMAHMFGWTIDELLGAPGSVVWPSADDYAEVGRLYGPELARGVSVDFERTVMRRDGSTFLARLRASAIDPRSPISSGTIWIVEDITAQRAADAALAAAKNEAEAANRAKSAFLANTSHEIRTPLNGLMGLARLALDPKATPAQVRDYLHGIQDSARQLTGIISDILDLSKIEAGKLRIERTDFDLHAVLESVLASYRELAEQHDLQLTLAIDPGTPRWVNGDPLRVRQIVTNYLSNALKFTVVGAIAIRAAPGREQRVRLAVSDTGMGIDAATQARLFTPFTQADESTTRRFGGTGLGLAICRQIAQMMDGEVGVDSEIDCGSTFWAELHLPPARDHLPADVAPVPHVSLASMRALLVEDNPVNLMIAEAILRNWGVTVETAGNGLEAVRAVKEAGGAFDVVLMDMHMPVMSGYEATRALREHYSADALPIVALTAAALVSEQQQCMSIGMNAFVTKPIDERHLRETLERFAPRAKAS